MYFDSWTAFIQMGGHGVYVWGAYALAGLVVIYNLVAPVLARRRVIREIRRVHRITINSGSVEVMNESGS